MFVLVPQQVATSSDGRERDGAELQRPLVKMNRTVACWHALSPEEPLVRTLPLQIQFWISALTHGHFNKGGRKTF